MGFKRAVGKMKEISGKRVRVKTRFVRRCFKCTYKKTQLKRREEVRCVWKGQPNMYVWEGKEERGGACVEKSRLVRK